MTDRIYYLDSYQRTFTATVVRRAEDEGRPAVVLDRTAFYPTSGGQPFDTGRLGAVNVLETVEREDSVVHVLSDPLPEGATVRGDIDWPRRFDHMQQHTGQHILSAAFDRLAENATVSFHMGGEISTIDLQREASSADIEGAVDAANQVVWEDRPVSVRFVSPEEAARLPLRKDPARIGTLRLIDIGGFDLSACGGTHVARSGAVGVIAALAWERHRGGTRLTFACGGRVVRALRGWRDAVTGCVRALSVLPPDLPAAVERMQNESRDLQKQLTDARLQLAAYEGGRLIANAREIAGIRVVADTMPGWDAAGLKSIATAAVAAGGACVALVSPDGAGSVVIARSSDLMLDANAMLRQLIDRFGGRGGGKKELAQGGGLTAPAADIAAAARAIIESVISG